jgi:uncharacterized membrane protein YczE
MTDVPSWYEILFKGHKTIPITSWRSTSRWKFNIKTFAVLMIGFFFFGVGEGLVYLSAIGNSPWIVLSEGLTNYSPFEIGTATLIISIFVFLLWIPLKEKPGAGTVFNILMIPFWIEITIHLFPRTESYGFGIVLAIIGVLCVGLGSALYLTTNLGPGPRDGLMTSLHTKTGVRVSRVRLSIETSVLLAGFLMGGTVGLGTLIFALGIGRAVALWLAVVARFGGNK